MTSMKVAQALVNQGYSVGVVTEPNEEEDGMVELLDMPCGECHIQVGFFSYGFVRVKYPEGYFFFTPAKKYLAEILVDIKKFGSKKLE